MMINEESKDQGIVKIERDDAVDMLIAKEITMFYQTKLKKQFLYYLYYGGFVGYNFKENEELEYIIGTMNGKKVKVVDE